MKNHSTSTIYIVSQYGNVVLEEEFPTLESALGWAKENCDDTSEGDVGVYYKDFSVCRWCPGKWFEHCRSTCFEYNTTTKRVVVA